MCKKETLIPLFFLLLFSLNGCSMPSIPSFFDDKGTDVSNDQKSVKGEGFEVETVMKGRNSLKGVYAHPLNISPDIVAKALQELSYQKREDKVRTKIMKGNWSEPMKVFEEKDIPPLASAIAKVLGNITENEEVYFRITSDRPIEGKTYISPQGWYWHIIEIDGTLPKQERVGTIHQWKLNLARDDSYVITSSRYSFKNLHLNWLMRKLPDDIAALIKKDFKAKTQVKKEKKTYVRDDSNTDDSESDETKGYIETNDIKVITKKVMVLDGLKKDGLITEEEYQRKLRLILNKEL